MLLPKSANYMTEAAQTRRDLTIGQAALLPRRGFRATDQGRDRVLAICGARRPAPSPKLLGFMAIAAGSQVRDPSPDYATRFFASACNHSHKRFSDWCSSFFAAGSVC